MSFVVYSFWTQRLWKGILRAALLLGASLSLEAGQNVMLTWNPSTNSEVAGYNVYCGTHSHVYTNAAQVGNVTNTVLPNLTPGMTYYFSAKSYDSSTNESAYANETVFTVPWPPVVNLPPTLRALANVSISRNSGLQHIALGGITPGTTNGSPIKITVTSSNPNLINPTVTYASPKNTGTLSFKPSINSTGSVTITVTVDNGGASNNIVSQTFNVTVVTPVTEAMLAALPKIYREPESQTIPAGRMVILSVGVSGRAPFQYQWQFNGSNIPGATSDYLLLRNFNSAQAGSYSVQVSNLYGSTNSTVAVLTLPGTPAANLAQTSISIPPANAAATLSMKPPAERGQFSFQITGISGSNYVVETSSDLMSWSPLCTNASPFVYTETNSLAYSHRFYRAAYQP